MFKCYVVCAVIAVLALTPMLGHANARLVSVTPVVAGGCVAGPTGPGVQTWDVERGMTYTLRITHVTECATNGTDPFLNVRVNSETHGNTDIVAVNVAPGVYEFNYTMPSDGVCTFPILYCTTPGAANTGIFVTRDDGVTFQAHLRASSFEPGCMNPTELLGPWCQTVPVDESTWGKIKALYE